MDTGDVDSNFNDRSLSANGSRGSSRHSSRSSSSHSSSTSGSEEEQDKENQVIDEETMLREKLTAKFLKEQEERQPKKKVSRWDTRRSSTNGTDQAINADVTKISNGTSAEATVDPNSSALNPKSTASKENTKKNTNLDMFSENDMFGDNFLVDKLSTSIAGKVENPNLMDNWDDAEGYYRVRIGETLDHRCEN